MGVYLQCKTVSVNWFERNFASGNSNTPETNSSPLTSKNARFFCHKAPLQLHAKEADAQLRQVKSFTRISYKS